MYKRTQTHTKWNRRLHTKLNTQVHNCVPGCKITCTRTKLRTRVKNFCATDLCLFKWAVTLENSHAGFELMSRRLRKCHKRRQLSLHHNERVSENSEAAHLESFISAKSWPSKQGCQMVYFPTKNPNLVTFWRTLEWKRLLYIMVISNILIPLCIFYWNFVILFVVWCIIPQFGILYLEKSGNPAIRSGFPAFFLSTFLHNTWCVCSSRDRGQRGALFPPF
jgi:hypothetical protein